MDEEASGSGQSAAERFKERSDRLKKLHLLRNAGNNLSIRLVDSDTCTTYIRCSSVPFIVARKQNHVEVVAEDERLKLPANWESRQRQADWLISDEKGRADALAKGLDYDRVKLNNVSATEAANQEKRKKKKNPDVGFSDYEAQTARQYNRLVKQMPPPDMAKYDQRRQALGDEVFYGGANTIIQGTHKDTPKAIDNMVKDLESQIMKRKSFSRRRTHNDDADIDYINEKNARFNKKLDRYYGEHTAEIKQNLERGTAI